MPSTIASRIRSPTGYARFVATAAALPWVAPLAIGSNASAAITAADVTAAIAPSSQVLGLNRGTRARTIITSAAYAAG